MKGIEVKTGKRMRSNLVDKNKSKVLLTLVLPLIVSILLQGCTLITPSTASAEKKITNHLKEIYQGEDFEILELKGPGTPGTTFKWTAFCSPLSNPDVVFEVEMGSDGIFHVPDTYQNEIGNTLLKKLVDETFHEQGLEVDSYLVIYHEQNKSSNTQYNDMKDYLDQYTRISISGCIYIHLSATENIDFGTAFETSSAMLYEKLGVECMMFVYVIDDDIQKYNATIKRRNELPIADGWTMYYKSDCRCYFLYQCGPIGAKHTALELNRFLQDGYIETL